MTIGPTRAARIGFEALFSPGAPDGSVKQRKHTVVTIQPQTNFLREYDLPRSDIKTGSLADKV